MEKTKRRPGIFFRLGPDMRNAVAIERDGHGRGKPRKCKFSISRGQAPPQRASNTADNHQNDCGQKNAKALRPKPKVAVALVAAGLVLPAVVATWYVQTSARKAMLYTPPRTAGGTAVHSTMMTMAIKAAPHLSWQRTWRGGAVAGGDQHHLVPLGGDLRRGGRVLVGAEPRLGGAHRLQELGAGGARGAGGVCRRYN
mgnify:CR=1 FL=1